MRKTQCTEPGIMKDVFNCLFSFPSPSTSHCISSTITSATELSLLGSSFLSQLHISNLLEFHFLKHLPVCLPLFQQSAVPLATIKVSLSFSPHNVLYTHQIHWLTSVFPVDFRTLITLQWKIFGVFMAWQHSVCVTDCYSATLFLV